MKTKIIFFSFFFFFFSFSSDKLDSFDKWTETQKASYAIGINVATSLSAPDRLNLKEVDYDQLLQAMNDVFNNDVIKYDMRDSAEFWQGYVGDVNSRKSEDVPVVSYMIGVSVAKSIPAFVDIDRDLMMKGFIDVYEKNTLYMNDSIAISTVNIYMEEQGKIFAAENLIKSEDFLDKNSRDENIIVTSSGLQYKILEKGTGTIYPQETDNVTVHYHGTIIDGTVFDSSIEREEPATFDLSRVIPGWTEGVQLMNQGDKFRFFIHPDLAYRDRAAGAIILPNSVLIFDVELISIN